MTFNTSNPSACGILELDGDGVVIDFHERVEHLPRNLANGAVYLLELEVLQWICDMRAITDFGTQVLPHSMGRITTWHNEGIHIYVEAIEAPREAQAIVSPEAAFKSKINDDWSLQFASNPIHAQIKCSLITRTSESLTAL